MSAIAGFVLAAGLSITISAQPSIPGTPRNLAVAHVQGQQVTFRWSAPAANPDGYVLEGGVAAGQVLASLPIAGSAVTASVTLPDGVYFARLHALRGAVRSAASNEVEIIVGQVRRPAAPVDVRGLALGPDVAIEWQQPATGGPAAQMLVDVTGSVQATLVAPAGGPLVVGGVPPGLYTVRLRARNALGDSESSAPLSLKVPGASVQPAPAPQPIDGVRLPVRHETFTTPRLWEFITRERIVDVVATATTEFDAILRLKDWVAAQFPKGTPDPYPPWDAMTILDWIRSGRTGGFCAQYAQILVQALAAFGVPARYVELGTVDNPYAHFAAEVWSNEFNKWVYLDGDFNVHFERDGVPQSALQIHEAFVRGEDRRLTAVLGQVRTGHPNPLDYPRRTTEFFYYHRYHLKADHVTVPDEPPAARFEDAVEWQDSHTVPWEISTVPSAFPKERLTLHATGDRSIIESRPNQVWITARRTGPMQVTLDLQHNMLQLQAFEFRVVDAAGVAGGWRRQTSAQLVWQVGVDDRRLEVRGVNVMGRTGPTAAAIVVQ